MADTVVASAPAPASASPAASAPVPPVAPGGEGKPSQGQEPVKADPAKVENERRAAALARTKREAARVHADREALKGERAAHQEALRKAADYDRLAALQKADPVAYMEAVGLDFGETSKRYLEKRTGANRSPAELVKEEVDKRMAAEAKAREDANAKWQSEEQIRRNRETEAGAQRQLSTIAKDNPDRFELVGATGDVAIKRAWKLIEDYYAESKQILDFPKALDAIEAQLEREQLSIFSSSKKIKAAIEKQKQEAADAAKKPTLSSTKPNRSVEPSRTVETATPSPVTPQLRRPKPLDYRRIADQLVADLKARHDN